MKQLQTEGLYTITDDMKAAMADFIPGFATEADTAEEIHTLYDRTGYVIDTHTAVASSVYRRYRQESGDETETVIVSTASPFKFARSVMSAVIGKDDTRDDFEIIDDLAKTANVTEPPAITEIRTSPVRHDRVCETADMQKEVRSLLGLPAMEV